MSDLQDTGFWSRFWSRLTGKTQLNKGGSSHPAGDYTSSGGAIVNPETALRLSAVWACVKLRAETISTLPLHLYDSDKKIAKDHDLYRILHDSPNADMCASEFWQIQSASLDLWGNAYSYISRRTNRSVISLEPLFPSEMVKKRLKDGSFEYHYTGSQYGADFAGMMMGLVDQSSSAYAILYGVQKGFNLASAIMNGYTAISAAWASAPFPYNLPAVAMATMETGVLQAAISAVSPVGMAHDGIDNIPKEGTWLLDGGERVLNPNQNKDLTNYLSQAQSNSSQSQPIDNQIRVAIFDDRADMMNQMYGREGEKVVMYHLKRNGMLKA